MLLMGKSTISMAIFNSYVKLPEGTTYSTIVTGLIAVTLASETYLYLIEGKPGFRKPFLFYRLGCSFCRDYHHYHYPNYCIWAAKLGCDLTAT